MVCSCHVCLQVKKGGGMSRCLALIPGGQCVLQVLSNSCCTQGAVQASSQALVGCITQTLCWSPHRYGWLPWPAEGPETSLAYLPTPCFPVHDTRLAGEGLQACVQQDLLAAVEHPADMRPKGVAIPHACAGKWVLVPNTTLCSPSDMVRTVQRAGGKGLIIHAARYASDLQVVPQLWGSAVLVVSLRCEHMLYQLHSMHTVTF
jgi:hypothetical protein